jgi:hypothetical protein
MLAIIWPENCILVGGDESMAVTSQCQFCGKELTYKGFGHIPTTCKSKACKKAYNQRWYLEHKHEMQAKYRENRAGMIATAKKNNRTEKGKARKVYFNIRRRCENPKAEKYKLYGAKGVRMLLSCKRFCELYLAVTHCASCGVEFIHNDPNDRKTTDRINVKGHYEESNIQFLCNFCNGSKNEVALKAKAAKAARG